MFVEYSRLRKQLGLEVRVEISIPAMIKRKIIGSKAYKRSKGK